jgi:hypothetical protein
LYFGKLSVSLCTAFFFRAPLMMWILLRAENITCHFQVCAGLQ